MKPNFIIGGIMKSGTTFLYNLVRSHPQIEMPTRSMDRSFFDNDEIYKRGIAWYETIFDDLDNSKVIGQVSADCAFNIGSIERIKKYIPNVKLIFIIRHPIDRAYSLYWHQVKMGREFNSFEKAIELEKNKIKKNYYNFKMYSYLERSRYDSQFKNVFNYFDENQLLFIPFEFLIKNELKGINLVFDFLGVDKVNDLSSLNINKISKNKARIPKYLPLLRLTSYLDKMNLTRVGKFILNRALIEKTPPKMSNETRKRLETVLFKDIKFHNDLMEKYTSDLNSNK